MSVLRPYIEQNIVSLIDWPDRVPADPTGPYAWVVATQVPAYEHMCQSSQDETKWLALIDIDEFLVAPKANSVLEVLEAHDSAPGIHVWWQVYGTSGLKTIPENTLLIEALHRIAPPDHDLNQNVIKTILKPKLFDKFVWPAHRCSYKNQQGGVGLDKSELRLNHYISRTIDYFYESKLQKKEKGTNSKLSQMQIDFWLNVGNDLEDLERPISRFFPTLRQKMGYAHHNSSIAIEDLVSPSANVIV